MRRLVTALENTGFKADGHFFQPMEAFSKKFSALPGRMFLVRECLEIHLFGASKKALRPCYGVSVTALRPCWRSTKTLFRLSDTVPLCLHLMVCKAGSWLERQLLSLRNAMRQWRNYGAGDGL